MNKIRNLLFIVFFAICSTSLVIVAEEEVIEEEVKGPSNPQELLEIVRQGKFADSEEQKDRESRFNAEKGKYYHIFHDKGKVGDFLKGFFGYNSNPNYIEFFLWLFFLIFGLKKWANFYYLAPPKK